MSSAQSALRLLPRLSQLFCKEKEGADIYVTVVFRGHHLCVAPWALEICQSEWRCTVSVTHTQDFEDLVPTQPPKK